MKKYYYNNSFDLVARGNQLNIHNNNNNVSEMKKKSSRSACYQVKKKKCCIRAYENKNKKINNYNEQEHFTDTDVTHKRKKITNIYQMLKTDVKNICIHVK